MQNLLTGKHLKLLGLGIIILVVGYILLAQGPVNNPLSLSVAPILLIGGYCVIIPAAIILKDKEQKKSSSKNK